ncbi:MAG TPA: MFS transporter [Paenirhodobacter sp.]
MTTPMPTSRKRILGWWFFDWASQPFNTLLLTFVFAPFLKDLLGSGTAAQTVWGYGVGATGFLIALASPFLGAIADRSGRRMPFIWLFSVMYVLGAWGLWQAEPGHVNLIAVMGCFAIGMIGMEFATTFSNAMLPDIAPEGQIGRVSGSGWAFGYLGGMLSLVIMLGFLQINPATGHTLIGLPPIFGLDPATREDTRIVGPLTAVWYAVFMVPFFLWLRDNRQPGSLGVWQATRGAWPDLRARLIALPKQRGLFRFLIASMLYRDGLNGLFIFGGLYAKGVLDWSITQIGLFGILATLTGAAFAWLGGKADDRFGPRGVIIPCLLVLIVTVWAVIYIARDSVFGHAVGPGSILPDLAFYLIGALIGAAGGALQSASRTLLVRQADPARITEAFGLYALSGKATAFIAPVTIAVMTQISGSQSVGITPLIVLFVLGLVLLLWARPTSISAAGAEHR